MVQSELQKINSTPAEAAGVAAAFPGRVRQRQGVFQENQLRVDLARQKLSALGLNASRLAAAQKRDEATPKHLDAAQYELRAPIAGRIVERKVDVGTAVGKEGDPADVYTVADCPRCGSSSRCRPRNSPRSGKARGRRQGGGRSAEGKVVFVSRSECRDPPARVVVLPNKGPGLAPRHLCHRRGRDRHGCSAVRVGKTALQTIEGKRVVFVRTDEGFEKREVELGRSDDDGSRFRLRLKPGEEIAVAKHFLLKAELGKSEADHALRGPDMISKISTFRPLRWWCCCCRCSPPASAATR